MNRWKIEIEGIKTQLLNLTEQLRVFLDKKRKEDLYAQLLSVEKNINNLTKAGIEVPNELRELKLRLMSESDQLKEAATARKELEELLLQYVQPQKPYKKTPKKEVPKRKVIRTSSTRVKLIDLIKAQVLSPNTGLYRKYKNGIYRAVITTEGQIQLMIKGHTQYFDTPSGAAKAVTKKPTDGWTWWLVENESKFLDEYRKKYFENETGK